MSTDTPSDPHESALETAEELQEDLEAIAESDLPVAYDTAQILKARTSRKRVISNQ
jgi:broad specificity phosphatase PhoE